MLPPNGESQQSHEAYTAQQLRDTHHLDTTNKPGKATQIANGL